VLEKNAEGAELTVASMAGVTCLCCKTPLRVCSFKDINDRAAFRNTVAHCKTLAHLTAAKALSGTGLDPEKRSALKEELHELYGANASLRADETSVRCVLCGDFLALGRGGIRGSVSQHMDHKHGRKVAVEVRVGVGEEETPERVVGSTEPKQSLNPEWGFGSSTVKVRRADAEAGGVLFVVVAGEEENQVDVATCRLSIADLEAEVRASEQEEHSGGTTSGFHALHPTAGLPKSASMLHIVVEERDGDELEGEGGVGAEFWISVLGVKCLEPVCKPAPIRQQKRRSLGLKGAAANTKTLTDYFSVKGPAPAPATVRASEPTGK
jgi:hypothetical protein